MDVLWVWLMWESKDTDMKYYMSGCNCPVFLDIFLCNSRANMDISLLLRTHIPMNLHKNLYVTWIFSYRQRTLSPHSTVVCSSSSFFCIHLTNLPQCRFLIIFVAPSSSITNNILSSYSTVVSSASISWGVYQCDELDVVIGWSDLSASTEHVLWLFVVCVLAKKDAC